MARLNKTPLQIRAKRGTEAQITATSPVPYQLQGEIAYATDNEQFYISNGTKFNPFASMDIGTAQGQMAFYDATLGKWTYTETTEMFWDDTGKILTFGNFPITPSSAPTTNYQVANKKYVDDNAAKLDDGTTVGQMAFWNGSTWTYTETTEMFWDDTNKRLGIGTDSPTAVLHLKAGTATNPPLKFTSGTLLTTPEAGTIEYDGCRTYVTNVATQRAIDRTSDVAVATVTVENTTTETTIWTGPMAADSLCAGNVFKFHANGIISSDSVGDLMTIRVKVGGVTKATLVGAAKKLDNDHFHIDAVATQRTIGSTGSRAIHIDMMIDEVEYTVTGVATIDTTANMDVTITAQWNNADAGDVLELYQGFMEYKN